MNINELFDVAEEFFDIIYPNFCDDYVDENMEFPFSFWEICEEWFHEMGPQIL